MSDTPEDLAAAKADVANDLKKCYPEAGGALIETVGYGGAPLFMARSKIVALHGATEPGCSTIVVDAAVPNDEWRVREPLSSLVAKVGCGHAAPKIEPDPAALCPMLQAMQSGEMSVSRGVELLDMWLAGNYSDDQLPPIRHGLGLDELPWDRIDALTAEVARLAHLCDDKHASMLMFQKENVDLAAQRDELLAALELVDGHVKLFLGHYKPCHNVYEAVQSAIARAKL